MPEFVKTTHSRVGRNNQSYSDVTGARLVAGCVILNDSKTKILMVQSSSHKCRWVLPKGGVEIDEIDYKDTAIRESWEEAGVIGKIVKYLGVIEDSRPSKRWIPATSGDKIIKHSPRSEFYFYELELTEICDEYPEKNKRLRRWFSYLEAKSQLEKSERYEFLEILEKSSIKKNI